MKDNKGGAAGRVVMDASLYQDGSESPAGQVGLKGRRQGQDLGAPIENLGLSADAPVK